MDIRPIVSFADLISDALVVGLAASRWRRIDQGTQGVMFGYLVWVLQGIPMVLFVVVLHRHTIDLQEIALPFSTAAFLWGLSNWQQHVRPRSIMRAAIPAYVIGWIVLHLIAGRGSLFSEISTPVESLLVLAAAAYTLVRNGTSAGDNPTSYAWFWISTGLMLNFGTEAPLDPLTARAFSIDENLSTTLLMAHSVISIVANCLVAWGVMCKAIRPASGGYSFSSASSRSS